MAEGPTHHFALGIGHHAGAIEKIAEILGHRERRGCKGVSGNERVEFYPPRFDALSRAGGAFAVASGADTGVGALYAPPPSAFRRVTLEVSLKPFRAHDENSIRSVCQEIFRSWAALLRRCDGCAVMLWSADGSEILEYRGRMDDAFDWARYLGDANPPKAARRMIRIAKAMHARNWLYMDDPPQVTTARCDRLSTTLKKSGAR